MDSDARSRKDFISEMVNKSHHAGKVYRLPCVAKLKDPMTKSRLKAWTSAFLAQFDETEQMNVKHTMFLWRSEDDMSADAVRNGIPGSAADVKWLFSNSRLLKQDFTPELTEKEMQTIEAAGALDFPENHASETLPTSPCKKCSIIHHGSCPSVVATYDKVVQKITGNQYRTAWKLFEGGPDHPTKKLQNLTYMRKTMENFKSHMSNYINLDLLPQFENGQYHTWTILLQAVYRVYKIEHTQENMSQLFKNIEEIVSAGDKSTETKIGNLREVLRRIQVKGRENYFISRDHDHGREVQTVDEQYSPQVNTLLTYILFKESIDKKRWDEVQLAFERKIESGWSYAKWHQTRPELYKLMDTMQKSSKSSMGGALCSIDLDENVRYENENDPVANKIDELQLEINQLRRGQWQNSNRYRSWNNQGYRKEANGQQRTNWKPGNSNAAQRNNVKEQLCTHCTHHGGTAVYHNKIGNYSGGDECIYDRNGAKKGNPGFRNRVAKIEDCDGPEVSCEDDELRQYYQDRLEALANITNTDE